MILSPFITFVWKNKYIYLFIYLYAFCFSWKYLTLSYFVLLFMYHVCSMNEKSHYIVIKIKFVLYWQQNITNIVIKIIFLNILEITYFLINIASSIFL